MLPDDSPDNDARLPNHHRHHLVLQPEPRPSLDSLLPADNHRQKHQQRTPLRVSRGLAHRTDGHDLLPSGQPGRLLPPALDGLPHLLRVHLAQALQESSAWRRGPQQRAGQKVEDQGHQDAVCRRHGVHGVLVAAVCHLHQGEGWWEHRREQS